MTPRLCWVACQSCSIKPCSAIVSMRYVLQVSLLAACHRRGIPVLCVAGAGAKADPTRLRIADVSHSNVDPLARAVRP